MELFCFFNIYISAGLPRPNILDLSRTFDRTETLFRQLVQKCIQWLLPIAICNSMSILSLFSLEVIIIFLIKIEVASFIIRNSCTTISMCSCSIKVYLGIFMRIFILVILCWWIRHLDIALIVNQQVRNTSLKILEFFIIAESLPIPGRWVRSPTFFVVVTWIKCEYTLRFRELHSSDPITFINVFLPGHIVLWTTYERLFFWRLDWLLLLHQVLSV